MDKFCNKIPYALDILTGEVIEVDNFDISNKGNLCCPYCKESIIFKGSNTQNKNGTWRRKHYSHKPNGVCINKVSSEGESLEHRESKEYIFNLLNSLYSFSPDFKIIKLAKEYQFINESLDINRIADVYVEFIYKDKLFEQAYEIQYSNITEEEFKLRHDDYKKLGIQDIWLVGLQYKDIKRTLKSIKEDEFYSDDGCKYIGDVEDFSYSDKEYDDRPFLRRLNSGLEFNKKLIHKKSISLYNKISEFQSRVYLISSNGLYLPKTIKTTFACGVSRILNDDSIFFTIEELNNYKSSKNNYYSSFSCKKYCTLNLSNTKTIGGFHLYNHNLINIHKQELNEGFFINGDNKLFHIKDSELKYADDKIKYFKNIVNEKEKRKLFESNIDKYKYNNPKNAQIYLTRLIAKFILSANNIIESNKTYVRRQTGDSLQWINKTLLTQEWKDKSKYGLYSSINKVLENMFHIIPTFSKMHLPSLIKKLDDIILFINKVECDYYEGLDYDLFIKEFNNSLYLDLYRSNEYENNKFKGLEEQIFYYGLREVFKGYCLSEIKGNINLFMYKSIFGNNRNELEERIKLEHQKLIGLSDELKDTYDL